MCLILLDSDTILYQPLIDGFCRMGHVDLACKVGFGKNVRKGRCMIEMEALDNKGQPFFPHASARMAAENVSRPMILVSPES